MTHVFHVVLTKLWHISIRPSVGGSYVGFQDLPYLLIFPHGQPYFHLHDHLFAC
jgi:hypothetical protein